MKARDIRRIHYGYVVVPDGYPDAGQPLVVTGFVVPHADGLVLFDTGMAPITDEVRERYHPRRRTARAALEASGVDAAEITAIVNCHQHLDHSGGNWEFPGVPVYVQKTELENARGPDFTYPQYTCDYADAQLEVIDGEHQMRRGLLIAPTPGHTTGHQSLFVDTDDGVVMLAGQAAETWNFSGAILSERLEHELGDRIGTYPDWVWMLRERNVERAMLSHELMIWERDRSDIGRPLEE
jgi:N-acyl homoserine lactone hydrolase